MEGTLLSLAVLACPVGMGLMMWFMGKGKGKDQAAHNGSSRDSLESRDSLADLRAEHARLGADIARLEGGVGDGSVRRSGFAETRP